MVPFKSFPEKTDQMICVVLFKIKENGKSYPIVSLRQIYAAEIRKKIDRI